MTNTLIFVDLPSPDPVATHQFYERLFGWTINERPRGSFHQIVPDEGLHLGIFDAASQPPDPTPARLSAEPPRGVHARTYILVDDAPDAYLDKALALGASEMWREQWWEEFGGWHSSFLDPWGNQIVMWENRDARNRRLGAGGGGE